MKRPLGAVVAFVIGAFVPYGLGPLSFFAWIISPAWILGMRLAEALPPDALFARFLVQLLSACANGLCFAGLWILSREVLEGRGFLEHFRTVFAGLMLSGLSMICFLIGQWIPAYEAPPRPIAALASDSPLTGRWESFAQAAPGFPSVVLICRPRVDGALDAVVYMNGQELGASEEGRVAGDSLYFSLASLSFSGERHADSLAVLLDTGTPTTSRMMALHLASPDTSSRL